MTEDLGDVDIPLLDRFLDAVDSPPASRRFRAVAVICDTLLNSELAAAPTAANSDFTLVVISIPRLHETYTAVFHAASTSAP